MCYGLFYFNKMEQKNNNDNRLNIELKEDVADGIYSNLAVISHSPSEFVVDFVRMLPGMPKATVKSRIIMTPDNAKRLLSALRDNVAKYEKMFGTIVEKDQPKMPFTFGGPTPEA